MIVEKINPIRPDEIAKQKKNDFPDTVFLAFNEHIAKKFTNKSAVVFQDDIVADIAQRLGITVQAIFENGWLNVEEIYREAGWEVEYDKPGYNESGQAFFRFTQPFNKR